MNHGLAPRCFLTLIAIALTVCFAATARAAGQTDPPHQTDRPNVILFIGDDIGWNDFGCYGNAGARTPAIDQLAAHGLKFTHAYLTASSCSPSRASIITGRYPHNTGPAAELHQPIAWHLPWFPTLLREAGYYTALVGKGHMQRTKNSGANRTSADQTSANRTDSKAFDLIDPGNTQENHGGHARWTQTLRDRPHDRPFFCWFAAYDAHRGWDADREWDVDRYGPRHDPAKVVVPPFLVDNRSTRSDLASYYNEVTRYDYYIGQVVEELRRQGELDNTLILVMADNGRPFPRAKTRLHDSGMQTALVAHWPRGITAGGGVCESLVSAIDLAPTILQVAGVAASDTMQGVSLLPLLSDPTRVVRHYAFSEHNWHDYEAHGRSVRTEQYLFVLNRRIDLPWQGPADSVRSPSHRELQKRRNQDRLTAPQADVFLAPRPEVELYDMAADPNQLSNLADDPGHASTRRRLQRVMDEWIEQTGDSVPQDLTPDRFDRESGDRLPRKIPSGTFPGSDRASDRVNRPGPR